MHEINMRILTPKRLLSRKDGRTIMETIQRIYPEVLPEKYGNYEPFKNTFDQSNIEEFLDHWHDDVFWSRRKPHISGSVGISWSKMNRHASVRFEIPSLSVKNDKLTALTRALSTKLIPDYGYIHLLTQPDIGMGDLNRTVMQTGRCENHYSMFITGHDLEKNIPDLYWATIFGDAYIRHFGRERLLSVPASIVEELPGGCIYIQLSDNPLDLDTDFDAVNAVRMSVKEYLNNNSLFDPIAAPDHIYNVPEFHLEPLPEKQA